MPEENQFFPDPNTGPFNPQEDYDPPVDDPDQEPDLEQDQEQDQEQEQAPDQEPLEDTYNIQVGDQTVSATLEELKRTYSRSQELQREREAVLRDRDMLQNGANKLASEYTDFSNKYEILNQLHKQFSDGKIPVRPRLENYGQGDDPIKQIMDYSKDVEAYHEWQDKFRAVSEEKNRRDLMEAQASREREMRALKTKIPEFADPSKEASLRHEMRETLESFGLPGSELDSITDHRVVLLLHAASQQRQAAKGVKSVAKKAKAKQVRSTTPRVSQDKKKKLLDEFGATGNEDLAVQYLMMGD